MANDWIKARGHLTEHPKVMAIAKFLRSDAKFMEWAGNPSRNASHYIAAAALLRVWSAAREHGVFSGQNLVLHHSNIEDLDTFGGVPSVGEAMKSVEWAIQQDGVTLPRFDSWNAPRSAAERSADYRSRHKTSSRKPSRSVTQTSREVRDEPSRNVTTETETETETEEDKTPIAPTSGGGVSDGEPPFRVVSRRGDKPPSTNGQALAIYEAYPRHVGKAAALVATQKALAKVQAKGHDAAWLLGRVQLFAASPAGKAGAFTPHCATWMNQGRFDDDDSEWNTNRTPVDRNPSRVHAEPSKYAKWD